MIEKASSMNHRAGFGLSGYLILTALVSFVLPTRTDGLRRVPFTVLPHHELASEIINNEIPDDVSIAVQYDLYTKVPNRETKLPMRLWALDHVDWVFLDLKGRPADLFGEEKREEREAVYSRLQSDEYREVYGDWNNLEMSDGYLVLVRVNTR